jgi:hypothetical protein
VQQVQGPNDQYDNEKFKRALADLSGEEFNNFCKKGAICTDTLKTSKPGPTITGNLNKGLIYLYFINRLLPALPNFISALA